MKNITPSIIPAKATISLIYFQLGDAKDLHEGDTHTANILGQRVRSEDYGESFSPMTFEYNAIVVSENNSLKWRIETIKALNV